MHQMPIDSKGTEIHDRVFEADRGLVGNANSVDIALPVVDDVHCSRSLRRSKRRGFSDGPWNALPHLVGVDIEPGFNVRRELIADIPADSGCIAKAVIPKSLCGLSGCGDEAVPWPVRPTGIGLQTTKSKAAQVKRDAIGKGIASARRHEIDRTAKRVGAKLQSIGALVYCDILVSGWIDFLKIAISVGGIDRNTVHVELDTPQMKVARQPGTADR